MVCVYYTACSDKYKVQHVKAYEMLYNAIYDLYEDVITDDMIRTTERGKPYISDRGYEFNISHCNGLVICAVSTDESDGAVGCDCEDIREFRDIIIKRVFSEKEKELAGSDNRVCTKLWTMKESYVKMTGTGLAGHYRDYDFIPDENGIFAGDGIYINSFPFFLGEKEFSISVCTKGRTDIKMVNCDV